MTAFQFPGINLALATPFDAKGAIDFARLEAYIERFLAAGITGFVLSSGTGMHVYLSPDEAQEVIARGSKIINGRARVIAQTSALMAEDVATRTRRARDAGADGVMVLPPFFEGPTDDAGIVDFYAEVSSPRVVLAVNGHAQSFGFLPRKLMHVFTYASLTAPFDPGRLGGGECIWAATPALPMGTTIRRLSGAEGDRILVRSRYTYNASITVSDAASASAGRLHDRKLAGRFPSLAGHPMQYRWAGTMALIWSSVSIVEETERGLWLAAGCNGVGATNATANGIVAAERAISHVSDLGRAFTETPAQTVPPEPIARIGGKAALKRKELRAGDE